MAVVPFEQRNAARTMEVTTLTEHAPEPDEITGDEPNETPNEDATPEGAEALGDPGKKALDSMKSKWRDAEKRAREAEARAAALEQAAADKDKTPDEQAIEQARREARAEADARANERIIRSEVKAAAAGKLANPAIALKLIDLASFEVDGDGNVDPDAIADAIDDLLKENPYLAAQGRPVQFDSARGKPAPVGPKQLTADEVTALYKAKDYDAIAKAKAEGRLADYLAS